MRIAGIDRLLGTNKKALLTNTILIANAFIWYLFSFKFLVNDISARVNPILNPIDYNQQLLILVAINFLGLFTALVIGEFLSHKMKNRLNFLLLWMAAGIFLSLAPLIGGGTEVGGMTYLSAVLFSAITGINFGFGIPLCLGYFASTTEAVNRGKHGGIIFLLTGVGASLILLLVGTIGESFVSASLILAIWRASGVVALFFAKRSVAPIPEKKKFRYVEILTNRTFLLYFIPWLMFQIINSLSFPINEKIFGLELVNDSSNVEFILGGISAVVFGFLADAKGRKRLAVVGFALLGLGYAVLGFTSVFGYTSTINYAWPFYTFLDGITWGSFVMLFVFALWGDLAEGRSSERLYAVAIVPYLLSSLMRLSLGKSLAEIVTIENFASTFSLFSFFLFIAVLPLVLAPETLSDQTIKNNDLRSYVDKAQKQVSKIKKKKSESEDEENAESKSEDQSEEIKKAQELAEKYY